MLKDLCNILLWMREMEQEFCLRNPEQGNRDVREDHQLIGEEPPRVWMFSRRAPEHTGRNFGYSTHASSECEFFMIYSCICGCLN